MAKENFKIEWKARDFKNNHAWIADIVESNETPLCSPERLLPYIKPARFANIGKKCRNCLATIEAFRKKHPSIPVYFQEYTAPVKTKKI